jgi:hypothetical protein
MSSEELTGETRAEDLTKDAPPPRTAKVLLAWRGAMPAGPGSIDPY